MINMEEGIPFRWADCPPGGGEVVDGVIVLHVTAQILTGGIPTRRDVFGEEEHEIGQEEEVVDETGQRVYEQHLPDVVDDGSVEKE